MHEGSGGDINTVDVAVIGAGVWGSNHIRELQSMGVLRAVHDSNPDAHPNIVPLETIWKSRFIDAVVIATPPKTHCDLTLQAIQARKHVLVEKPMAVTDHDATLMRRYARDYGRILMVGHLMRYHSGFVRLLEIVKSGTVGNVEYVYTNRLQPGRIRTEENSLWSLAPHDISMLVALCGLPISVACTGSPLRGDMADVTMCKLNWNEGIKGHVFVSWLHPRKERLVYVIGSKGSAAFAENGVSWSVALNGNMLDAGTNGNPLRMELEHFVHCIDTNTQPLTDAVEGNNVVRVLSAAQFSMNHDGDREAVL